MEERTKYFPCAVLNGSTRSVVKYVWAVFFCNEWKGLRGLLEERRIRVVFHFCSGGGCPLQTITMLLHYHRTLHTVLGTVKTAGSFLSVSEPPLAVSVPRQLGTGGRGRIKAGNLLFFIFLPASRFVAFIASEQRDLLTVTRPNVLHTDLSHPFVQTTVLFVTCLPKLHIFDRTSILATCFHFIWFVYEQGRYYYLFTAFFCHISLYLVFLCMI